MQVRPHLLPRVFRQIVPPQNSWWIDFVSALKALHGAGVTGVVHNGPIDKLLKSSHGHLPASLETAVPEPPAQREHLPEIKRYLRARSLDIYSRIVKKHFFQGTLSQIWRSF